jgi:hypothetical protein
MSLKNCFVTAIALVTLLLPIGAGAQGPRVECSNCILQGRYALQLTGTIIGVGNIAEVGSFVYDGNGNLAGSLSVGVNGNNKQLTLTGTYSVSPDCTFSDTWHLSDGGTTTHEAAIFDEGRSYFIVNTTPGDGSAVSASGSCATCVPRTRQ